MLSKNKKPKIIAIAAGGTGGHIFPAVAVAETMMNNNYKVVFITDPKFMNFLSYNKSLLKRINFNLKVISLKRKSGKLNKIKFLFQVFLSIVKIMFILKKNRVSAVIGFGSYVSLPSILAGRFLFKTTIIHEQNSHMGLANRISMFFSSTAMTGFKEVSGVPKIMRKKIIHTGNPVRESIEKLRINEFFSTINYKAFFSTDNNINILIIGGSQGASVFTDLVPNALGKLDLKYKRKLTITHQTKESKVAETLELYNKNLLTATVKPFFSNIGELMSNTHILISRAGAGTISEIQCLGVPSILIPYPSAKDNHQFKNALSLQKKEGATILQEKDATSDKLSQLIEYILKEKDILYKMHSQSKKEFSSYADIKIATIIETITFGGVRSSFYLPDIEEAKIFKGKIAIT